MIVGNVYDLQEIPDGVVLRTNENASDKELLKWSGKFPIPAIGDKVRINFNELANATVAGYFIEHGYLGVHCNLAKAPAWHLKQHPRGSKHHKKALVFGVEIEHLTYNGGKLVKSGAA